MKKLGTGILTLSLVLAGCASQGVRRGAVAMKMDDRTAHAVIGKGEVSVGDHVQLYKSVCRVKSLARSDAETCKKEVVGHGEVLEILNDDYVTVRFAQGIQFKEGDLIEKHPH